MSIFGETTNDGRGPANDWENPRPISESSAVIDFSQFLYVSDRVANTDVLFLNFSQTLQRVLKSAISCGESNITESFHRAVQERIASEVIPSVRDSQSYSALFFAAVIQQIFPAEFLQRLESFYKNKGRKENALAQDIAESTSPRVNFKEAIDRCVTELAHRLESTHDVYRNGPYAALTKEIRIDIPENFSQPYDFFDESRLREDEFDKRLLPLAELANGYAIPRYNLLIASLQENSPLRDKIEVLTLRTLIESIADKIPQKEKKVIQKLNRFWGSEEANVVTNPKVRVNIPELGASNPAVAMMNSFQRVYADFAPPRSNIISGAEQQEHALKPVSEANVNDQEWLAAQALSYLSALHRFNISTALFPNITAENFRSLYENGDGLNLKITGWDAFLIPEAENCADWFLAQWFAQAQAIQMVFDVYLQQGNKEENDPLEWRFFVLRKFVLLFGEIFPRLLETDHTEFPTTKSVFREFLKTTFSPVSFIDFLEKISLKDLEVELARLQQRVPHHNILGAADLIERLSDGDDWRESTTEALIERAKIVLDRYDAQK